MIGRYILHAPHNESENWSRLGFYGRDHTVKPGSETCIIKKYHTGTSENYQNIVFAVCSNITQYGNRLESRSPKARQGVITGKTQVEKVAETLRQKLSKRSAWK